MLEIIFRILSDHAQYQEKISLNTSLIDDLGIDSLSIFSIAADIEKEYNIEISPSEINYENFNCPKSILELINRKNNEKHH